MEPDVDRIAEWRRMIGRMDDLPQWSTTEELMQMSMDACHGRSFLAPWPGQ